MMVGGYDMNGSSGTSTGMDDQWIPILDYAVLKGVSTSTLRRYIKAKKIQYKVENGRYLLRADSQVSAPVRPLATTNWEGAPSMAPSGGYDLGVYTKVRELEEKLARANEQIGELKMLIAIYEEQLAKN